MPSRKSPYSFFIPGIVALAAILTFIATPGNFAYSRFDELSRQLADLKARFARVTG
jgi:hypothetical protein